MSTMNPSTIAGDKPKNFPSENVERPKEASMSETELTAIRSGRTIKFTPERLQQIKNLVERGLNREQIAETIGVTVGSLAVTCSRHGISLRQLKPDCTQGAKQSCRSALERMMSENGKPDVALLEITVGHRKIKCEVPLRAFIELCFEAQMTNANLGDVIAKKLMKNNG